MNDVKVVLISMVKNESKILQRCIDSCKGLCDAFCFLDTGSTDSTTDIIKEFLKTHDGALYQDPFKNFGYSRTKSFEVCKEYLQTYKPDWDLRKTYGVLLDADMILRVSHSFHKNLLNAPGYRIIQSTPILDYHNVRFICMANKWECIGVTHEYWKCEIDLREEYQFTKDLVYIDDVNDGGCKQDKYERDVRLLTKGLEEEPENTIRYTFYLAQSYESIDKEKAIEYYKKRVELGGWFEEIYIALIRIGDIYAGRGDFPNAVYHYLEATNVDIERSEALHRLAKLYRLKGKNVTSSKFVILGKQVKYPTNRSLFIEKNIYSYGFDEELSIIGFYINSLKDDGLRACEKLSYNRELPKHVRELAFSNLFFYTQKMQFDIMARNIWNIECHPGYKESSCSLLYHTDKTFEGIQRTVNYKVTDEGKYVYDKTVNTINYYITGRELQIKKSKEIKVLVPKKREATVQDLEDMRIVKLGGKVYGFGTTNDYGEREHPCQVLCKFNDDMNIYDIIQLKYKTEICQKNWCPFVYKKKLVCIYSYEPFIMLEINTETGDCTEIMKKYQGAMLSEFRGSTNPIKVRRNYYQIIHTVHFKDTRKYSHKIIKYDEDFNIVEISTPFYFENFFIEYCIGFGHDGEHFYIHYSSRDNSSNILKLAKLF